MNSELPSLLEVLCSSATRRDVRGAAKADAVLAALANKLEARLLLAPIYAAYLRVVRPVAATGATRAHAPLVPLFVFARRVVDAMSNS